MENYEQYYQNSLEALNNYIKEKNNIPTEKEWNKLAAEEGYLTSQTIGYISEEKFTQLCKKMYKDMRKKIKEEKKK